MEWLCLMVCGQFVPRTALLIDTRALSAMDACLLRFLAAEVARY